MRRRIYLVIAGVSVLLIGIFVWRLDIPNWKRLDFAKLSDIPASTLVYACDGNHIGALYGTVDRTFVELSEIPVHVQNAFIAAEDLRFYDHRGVDVYRLFGAMLKNLRSMRYAQGASTITQQLIKLTHLSGEKKLSRKAQEIFLALKLERILSKTEILECYLNTVYFGKGAYGLSAAANRYFGKKPSELTVAEGALLSGIIKSPSGYAPHIHPDKALSRRNGILETMFEQGFISGTDYRAALSEPIALISDAESTVQYGWYMDCVLEEAGHILSIDADEIYSGGYRIYTGIDPLMQSAADKLFADASNFPENASDGTEVQASITVLDTNTGQVRAIIGGRDYEVRRGLNRSSQILRQPGSAFKPVSTFAAAIDAYHFVPSSTVEDTPREFHGGYKPGNAGGGAHGAVSLREALSRSLNIATVDLAELIGIGSVRDYAKRFGLSLTPSDNNLAMSLGFLTEGVSPLALTGAYCALANGGTRVDPHFITKITDADGNILYAVRPPSSCAIKSSTAYMITDMLKTAASQGSAKALSAAKVPVAGKTGTVEGSGGGTKDIWTVAYTPEVAVTVWMGFDDPGINHELDAGEGGSGFPARLCAEFLSAVGDALSGEDFICPPDVRTVMIDGFALETDHSTLLCTDQTPDEYTVEELFHADVVPTVFSDYWTAPADLSGISLQSAPGEAPVISFTCNDAKAEYALYRHDENGSHEIAVLIGDPGEVLTYTDNAHDTKKAARYTIIPRNRLLYERDILLCASETPPLNYTPAGFLNRILGADTNDSVPAPADYEIISDQLLLD